MRNQAVSHVVPVAAAIAGVTLLAFTFGPALAHRVNNFRSQWHRGPLMTEPFEPGLPSDHMMSQGRRGEGWMRGSHWGYGPQHGRMFDPDTVETVRGKIVSTDDFMPATDMSPGMQISIDTGTETLPIHLGPRWFVDAQDFELLSGEDVEIRGSRVDFAGQSTIVASELQHRHHTLELRDANGIPAWSNWRRQDGRWESCCW